MGYDTAMSRCSRILLASLVLLGSFSMASVGSAHAPRAARFAVFAEELSGPEDLAFTRDGELVVGSTTGDVLAFSPRGEARVLASVGDPLAGITALSDGRVLAASVAQDRVWAIAPEGDAAIFAEGVGGPNFMVETADGRILVSGSTGGVIADITSGTPEVVIPDLEFPNGLAIFEHDEGTYLYVALTLASEVHRFEMRSDGSFGPGELYAEGLLLADGLAFDTEGNLLVVGGGQLNVVDAESGEVSLLDDDPLINWPANLAFGQGRGWSTRDVYLANFGPNFGDGTDVVRFRYNHSGDPLASAPVDEDEGCSRGDLLRSRVPLRGGAVRCPRPDRVRRVPVR